MNCRICEGKVVEIFEKKILNKHNIKYFRCESCNFIQTQEPFWLEEAYSSAISSLDTGLMQRNISLLNKTALILFYLFDNKSKFLDYAAGYGIFVRMMRDVGFDFYWEDKFCDNLLARGFESKEKKYTAITSFESFEHFDDPIKEIENMLSKSDNLIFTTLLIPDNNLPSSDWWYYSSESGQHISFYSTKTFEFLAKKYDLHFYSDGFIHILSKKKLKLLNKDLFITYHIIKDKIKALFSKKRRNKSSIVDIILRIKENKNSEISKILGSKTTKDCGLLKNLMK